MKRKVEQWEFTAVGDITHNIARQQKLAAVFVEVAIELGLMPDNRKEVNVNGQKTKVLQMRRGSDPQKLCSGI